MSLSLGLGMGLTDGGAPAALGPLTIFAPAPLFGWEAPVDGSTGLSPSGGKAVSIADSYTAATAGGRSLTQATSSKRASIDSSTKLARRPTLAFTNAAQTEYAASGGVTGNADHAMAIVWKSANNSSSYAAVASFGPAGGSTSALGKVSGNYWFGGSGKVDPTSSISDDLGWHILTKRHVSGATHYRIDGQPIRSNNAAVPNNPYANTYAITSAAFGLGTPWNGGPSFFAPDGNLAACDFYGTISASDFYILERYLALRFGLSKLAQVVAVGDSLTLGSTSDASHIVANPYPSQLPTLLGKVGVLDIVNLGAFGKLESSMLSDASTNVSPLFSTIRGIVGPTSAAKNVLVFWGGTNDLDSQGASAATVNGYDQTWVTARKAEGWTCLLATIIARNWSNGATEAVRQAVNTARRNNWQAWSYDGLVDLAADSRLSDYNDATYFAPDKVHLVQAGYDVVAALMAAGIAAFV